jgi:hypothetical protein
MKLKSITNIFVAGAFLTLASCTSVPERMEEKMPQVRKEWESAFSLAREGREVLEIHSWEQAEELFLSSNIDLKEAVDDAVFAERSVSQVYRRLLPEITLLGSLNKAVVDLDGLSFDDVFLVANGFISLPNPIEVRAQSLSAQLHELRSDIGGQLLVRELFASLYRLHRKQLSIDEDQGRLDALKALSEALKEASPSKASDIALEARKLQIEIRLAQNELQEEMGEFFGDGKYRYRFTDTFSPPELTYAGEERTIDALEEFGKLYAVEAAAQLVGMDLQALGIKLKDWPTLRAFTTFPSLYSVQSGDERAGDWESTRIGASISWSTDFRGERKLRKDQVLARHVLQRDRIEQAVQSEAIRLINIQREALEIHEEREKVKRQLSSLSEFVDSEVKRVRRRAMEETNNLNSALTALDDRITEINLLFWTLDDSQWEKPSKVHDSIFEIEIL